MVSDGVTSHSTSHRRSHARHHFKHIIRSETLFIRTPGLRRWGGDMEVAGRLLSL